MALVDGSSVTTNVRGRIGSTVYFRTRSGPVARFNTPPTFPNTPKQAQANAQVRAVILRWQNLTNAQRLAWMAAASSSEWAQKNRFGRVYQPAGYQLFMKLNLSVAYQVIHINDPPPKQVFPRVVPTSFVTSPDTTYMDLTINFSLSAFDMNFRLLVFATDNMSMGIMKSKPQFFRWINFYTSGDLTGGVNLKWSWFNVFGAQATPSRVFCKMFLVSRISGERIEVGLLPNY